MGSVAVKNICAKPQQKFIVVDDFINFSLTMVSLKGSSGGQKSSHLELLPGCQRAAGGSEHFLSHNTESYCEIGTKSSCENVLMDANRSFPQYQFVVRECADDSVSRHRFVLREFVHGCGPFILAVPICPKGLLC